MAEVLCSVPREVQGSIGGMILHLMVFILDRGAWGEAANNDIPFFI